jgi:hypothetical protein
MNVGIPDVAQSSGRGMCHAGQMPHPLELGKSACAERLAGCWLQMFGRETREATCKSGHIHLRVQRQRGDERVDWVLLPLGEGMTLVRCANKIRNPRRSRKRQSCAGKWPSNLNDLG